MVALHIPARRDAIPTAQRRTDNRRNRGTGSRLLLAPLRFGESADRGAPFARLDSIRFDRLAATRGTLVRAPDSLRRRPLLREQDKRGPAVQGALDEGR